jgi:hypothetical protein
MNNYSFSGKTVSALVVASMVVLIVISCRATKTSQAFPEDEFFVTRKYIGNFVEYSTSAPYYHGGPHVISLTTTQDSLYGRISAFSRDCKFVPGERLYIRRVYKTHGVFGNWKYQIENDNEKRISYQIKEFQYGGKLLEQSWF